MLAQQRTIMQLLELVHSLHGMAAAAAGKLLGRPEHNGQSLEGDCGEEQAARDR
jgi:hypothetical protein